MAAYNFYGFFTASKTGKTGLTVTCTVYDSAGNVQATAQAATAIGGGLYTYTHTDATAGDYVAVFATADATVDFQNVPALAAKQMVTVDELVWAYASRTLTQSAASVAAAVSGSTITIHRGDTISASLTGLGSIAGRTKLWFTAKENLYDADSASVLFIEETAGLTVVNGATYATTTDGDITVTDQATGALTITLDEAVSAALNPGQYQYDMQWLSVAGVVTLTSGYLVVTADITRAIA